jgi:hypothetical protein
LILLEYSNRVLFEPKAFLNNELTLIELYWPGEFVKGGSSERVEVMSRQSLIHSLNERLLQKCPVITKAPIVVLVEALGLRETNLNRFP